MADFSHAWIRAYKLAVEETDPQKLQERVVAAETAIFERLLQIASSPHDHGESEELHRACDQLSKLKALKLRSITPQASAPRHVLTKYSLRPLKRRA